MGSLRQAHLLHFGLQLRLALWHCQRGWRDLHLEWALLLGLVKRLHEQQHATKMRWQHGLRCHSARAQRDGLPCNLARLLRDLAVLQASGAAVLGQAV